MAPIPETRADPGYCHSGSSGTETTFATPTLVSRSQVVALTSWTQQLSLCVNQTFSPSGLSLGRGWGKKKGGREGKEEGKMGGSVSLSRLSSQRPPGKEKREDKSLTTYAWVGSGGSQGPPSPTTTPFAYLLHPLPSAAANAAAAAAAAASKLTLGSQAGHPPPPSTPTAQSRGQPVPKTPLLPWMPPPGTGPSSPPPPSPAADTSCPAPRGGWGRRGGMAGQVWRHRAADWGRGGAEGLSYLKWLFMILILIYTKILRPFPLQNRPLPVTVFTVFVKIVQCKYVFIIKSERLTIRPYSWRSGSGGALLSPDVHGHLPAHKLHVQREKCLHLKSVPGQMASD
nr:probable inactive serine/threonine-protein kinase slob2 isoform X1 [Vicugna pacos]XP_031527211.1 probable inactive serine/threonine-protein kinase slob2 isoform X2 [Vicugna pacos]XP_031527212.1 probable inactive serine/threonine-protein kinase slob2 isoform X3 [Vicugna pacos]